MRNMLEFMNEIMEQPSTPGSVTRAFRKKMEFTQKELSQLTGILENNISSIENDRAEIGVKTAVKLAAVFGISPARILFPNGTRIKSREVREIEKKTLKLLKTS
jgi:transcriptional regulator with XRE-family HTH domain